jgi:hypothetical protein
MSYVVADPRRCRTCCSSTSRVSSATCKDRCVASRGSSTSPIDEKRWPAIVEYCSFDWMKRNRDQERAAGRRILGRRRDVFINKGVNGRWSELLTAEECADYEARAVRELGPNARAGS